MPSGRGRRGEGGMEVGEEEDYIYTPIAKRLPGRDKVTRQCPQTTTFEEKGEPRQIRTEVPLLTSPMPYR